MAGPVWTVERLVLRSRLPKKHRLSSSRVYQSPRVRRATYLASDRNIPSRITGHVKVDCRKSSLFCQARNRLIYWSRNTSRLSILCILLFTEEHSTPTMNRSGHYHRMKRAGLMLHSWRYIMLCTRWALSSCSFRHMRSDHRRQSFTAQQRIRHCGSTHISTAPRCEPYRPCCLWRTF